MARPIDTLATALAPAVWGSTYLVTTEFLPEGRPLTLAMLRALPAGLMLLPFVRALPTGVWWLRIMVLGAFNFAVFWSLLFVAAQRLPGGVAATVGATQVLMVVLLARLLLGNRLRASALAAALVGMAGVALLVLTPAAGLDPIGLAAGLGGALSMAAGTVLTRKWQPPVPLLTLTAWQLTAGGVLLLPFALLLEPALPPLTIASIAGFGWLAVVGGALTYALWFRGVARIDPGAMSALGLFSPLTAVLLGWAVLDQSLTAAQILGAGVVLAAVLISQRAGRPRPAARPAPRPLPARL